VLTADETLALAEIKLAQQPKKAGLLAGRLAAFTGYKFVVVDCAPSLSLLNQNALCFADVLLVPVACDYLSLVGLKQLVKTVQHVREHLGHPVELGAVLPTLFDGRSRHAQDSLAALREHFGARVLSPVRVCVKLKEAPRLKRTIYEYAPDSTGAKDYLRVVEWAVSLAGHTATGRAQVSVPAAWPDAPAPMQAHPP
jgi:chromosome partitioning protein